MQVETMDTFKLNPILTFGGRPRFRAVGVVGLSGADEPPDFLFLLPLGRPRPRFCGGAVEVPGRI